MATTLTGISMEHLGSDATEQDVEFFRELCIAVMEQDGLDEADAITAVWGDGDYYSNGKRLLGAETVAHIEEEVSRDA